MSQQRIMEFLKKHEGKRFTAAQIIYHLQGKNNGGELSASVIYANLKRLEKNKDVNVVLSDAVTSKNRRANYYFHKEENDG